jgi:hypothetical protein
MNQGLSPLLAKRLQIDRSLSAAAAHHIERRGIPLARLVECFKGLVLDLVNERVVHKLRKARLSKALDKVRMKGKLPRSANGSCNRGYIDMSRVEEETARRQIRVRIGSRLG